MPLSILWNIGDSVAGFIILTLSISLSWSGYLKDLLNVVNKYFLFIIGIIISVYISDIFLPGLLLNSLNNIKYWSHVGRDLWTNYLPHLDMLYIIFNDNGFGFYPFFLLASQALLAGIILINISDKNWDEFKENMLIFSISFISIRIPLELGILKYYEISGMFSLFIWIKIVSIFWIPLKEKINRTKKEKWFYQYPIYFCVFLLV